MKILVVSNVVDHYCGYIVRIFSEIKEIQRCGNEITLIGLFSWKQLLFSRDEMRRFKEMFNELDIKVITLFSFPCGPSIFLSRIRGYIEMLLLNKIISDQEIDIIHCHSRFAFMQYKKKISIPIVFDMHGAVEELFIKESGLINQRYKKFSLFLEKFVINNSECIISVSEGLEEHWLKDFPDYAGKKAIVPCAVDLNYFPLSARDRKKNREKFGIEDNQPIFLYAGSAKFYQRIDLVISLYKAIAESNKLARFLLIIPSSDVEKVQELVKLQKSDLVEKIEIISTKHDDIHKLMQIADFGILIRDDILINNVASPTKFGEYLSMGLPVIASPYVYQVKNAITDFNIGYLITDINVDSHFSDFINNVMTSRHTWSKKCSTYVKDHYSWGVMGEKINDIYLDLVKRG
jgi:glycosyltransferase involved in cell wall biosynthesis